MVIKAKLAKIAAFLIKIQTFIILSFIYFLFFVPFGLIFKLFQSKGKKKESFWQKRKQRDFNLEDFYKQY